MDAMYTLFMRVLIDSGGNFQQFSKNTESHSDCLTP